MLSHYFPWNYLCSNRAPILVKFDKLYFISNSKRFLERKKKGETTFLLLKAYFSFSNINKFMNEKVVQQQPTKMKTYFHDYYSRIIPSVMFSKFLDIHSNNKKEKLCSFFRLPKTYSLVFIYLLPSSSANEIIINFLKNFSIFHAIQFFSFIVFLFVFF